MILLILFMMIIVGAGTYYYLKFIKNKDKCKKNDLNYNVIQQKDNSKISGFSDLRMGDVCWKEEDDVDDYCINDNVIPFANAAHKEEHGIEFTNVKFCNDKVEEKFIEEYNKLNA